MPQDVIPRAECALCHNSQFTQVLDLGESPLADYFPASPDEVLPRYPLRLGLCNRCGLAQLLDQVKPALLYGEDYGFSTGSSPAAVRAFQRFADDLVTGMPRNAAVTEIACNDGTLLDALRERAPEWRLLGVDPAAPARVAAGKGHRVMFQPFTKELAGEIRRQYGPQDAVLAFNVLAHVADQHDFLRGVRHLLSPLGMAVIEFQDCDALAAGCQFDHIYHEHQCFFGEQTFRRLAGLCGLQVTGMKYTGAQGGSLQMVCRPASFDSPLGLARAYTHLFHGLQARADYVRTTLVRMLADLHDEGHAIAGWAASAKSATLLNYCGIGNDLLDFVADITPAKIGRYTPGSNIPIVAEDDRGADVYLVMAWNYLGHVMSLKSRWLKEGGQLVIPVPVPVKLCAR